MVTGSLLDVAQCIGDGLESADSKQPWRALKLLQRKGASPCRFICARHLCGDLFNDIRFCG